MERNDSRSYNWNFECDFIHTHNIRINKNKKGEYPMIKNCLVCENEIFRSSNTRGIKKRRGKNEVTCSKKCAIIYNRKSDKIKKQLKDEKK